MIQDFVSKDARTPIAVIVDPIAANTSTNVIKLSPGSGTAAGAQVQGKFTLTPTSQITKGSQVEARVTLSQTRVK